MSVALAVCRLNALLVALPGGRDVPEFLTGAAGLEIGRHVIRVPPDEPVELRAGLRPGAGADVFHAKHELNAAVGGVLFQEAADLVDAGLKLLS